MNYLNKIKIWLKKNQEENSERYQEREELKEELEEYSKDIEAIVESPIFKINDRPLEKAILIQNLHTQRNLSKATKGLKTATWILAIATFIFAWVAIIDSPNSSYFIQVLQKIGEVFVIILGSLMILVIILGIIQFVYKGIKKISKKDYRKEQK